MTEQVVYVVVKNQRDWISRGASMGCAVLLLFFIVACTVVVYSGGGQ